MFSNRATCLKLIGKYKQAINDFKKALELAPRNTKNIKKLANVYVVMGNFGEAEILLQKCINLEPEDSTNTTEHNKIKQKCQDLERLNDKEKEQNWEEVEELCKKMLVDSPGFPHLKQVYVNALLTLCKIQDAITFLNNQVTSAEKETYNEFDYLLAREYYYNGEYDTARRTIEKLIKRSMKEDKYSEFLNNINNIDKEKTKANAIFKSGKYDEAIAAYTKLLEFDPTNKKFNSVIYANRGLCYKKQSKFVEGLRDLNQSLKCNPSYVTGYHRRGQLYCELKLFDDAKQDFYKMKELDPNNKDVDGLIKAADNLINQARVRDYYKILELDRNATPDQIKKAYRKLAIKWHPVRNAESEESKKIAQKKFIDIGDAYNVLSDPKKKQMYDAGCDPLNPEQGGMPGGAGAGGMNVDPSEIFKFFGGSGAGGHGGKTFFTTMGGGSDLNDFAEFFGGNGGGFSQFFNMGNMGGAQGNAGPGTFQFSFGGANPFAGFGGMGGQGKRK